MASLFQASRAAGDFERRNRPFVTEFNVDGTQQAFYKVPPGIAELWQRTVAQLDAEQADANDGLA